MAQNHTIEEIAPPQTFLCVNGRPFRYRSWYNFRGGAKAIRYGVTRSRQSIKIVIDLSIDKSIKIGKSDLIYIDFSDQSVEIDDTLVSFSNLSLILPISSIHIGRNISSSVHQKIKTVKLLTIEWRLKVEGSNSYHRDYIVYQTLSLIKKIVSNLQNQVLKGL